MEIPPLLIVLFIAMVYVISSIKILAEYERGVIFRLGKLLPRPKGPGIILVFAPIDRMVRVGLRTVVFDVPPQDVITRDNVGQGERGRLLSRHRSAQGGRRGRELQLRDVAIVADDAAQRAGTGGTGRSAVAA